MPLKTRLFRPKVTRKVINVPRDSGGEGTVGQFWPLGCRTGPGGVILKNNPSKFSLSWQIISLSEKVSFAGRVIPAGTGLMSNIYAAHTDPEVILL